MFRIGIAAAVLTVGALNFGCASNEKKFDDNSLMYLEEVEGEKALDWVKAQNDRTLKVLEEDPLYKPFFEQAKTILNAPDRIPYGKIQAGFVYNFWQDEKHVRGLWRRASLEQYRAKSPRWETLIDVDELAKTENENWVFKRSDCLAPDYKRCLIFLSRGGKDAGVVREFDIQSKKFVKDGFVLPEAKSSVAWVNENELIVATNWGEGSLTESGYPRILKRWKRGTPLDSATTIYEGDKKSVHASPVSVIRPEGSYLFILHAVGFYESEVFLMKDNVEIVKIPIPLQSDFVDVFKGQMIIKPRKTWSHKDAGEVVEFASGDLVSFSILDFLKNKKLTQVHSIFRPTDKMSFEGSGSGRDVLYVSYLDQVVGKILDFRFENGKWVSKPVPLDSQGTVELVSTDSFSHLSLVNYASYLRPSQVFILNSKSNSLKLARQLPPKFNTGDLIVDTLSTKSKDGTEVPYFLIRKKSLKYDGKAPTLLYGYGGFEISLTPFYSPTIGKLWLEKGGVFVVANIRGGGEFGPRWHQAALKENRQRAFDDFIAVAEDLIERKVTSPAHLGIQGGSNGGLLVGATFTQRPELFQAVVCQVPLLDMLRYHLLLAGASWKAEYGDPEVSSEKKFIQTYSPFQNLKFEKTYPEVLFVTSTKDDRVHPAHARKMAAKMEAMGKSFLYYENIEGGHSATANLIQRARKTALEMVYLNRKLGLSPAPAK